MRNVIVAAILAAAIIGGMLLYQGVQRENNAAMLQRERIEHPRNIFKP